MKLICYVTTKVNIQKPRIRPAPTNRDWMDETKESYAYRCLPLNIANTHGWEILSPVTFTATWDGGSGLNAITIESEDFPFLLPQSHFGSGVLTFRFSCLFQTEPGLNLWVGGPANRFKDGIAPLTGIVETDWSPFTFTMNWKFTRPGASVTFEKGEPICFFFPVVRGLVEQMEPTVLEIESDEELQEKYEAWRKSRREFNQDLMNNGAEAKKQKWQKYYYRGRDMEGESGIPDHQIKVNLKHFIFEET